MTSFLMDNLPVILDFLNIMILFFAAIFACWLLIITLNNSARTPWEYLMYSVMILIVINSISFLKVDISRTLMQVLNILASLTVFLAFLIQASHMRTKNYEPLVRKINIVKDKED